MKPYKLFKCDIEYNGKNYHVVVDEKSKVFDVCKILKKELIGYYITGWVSDFFFKRLLEENKIENSSEIVSEEWSCNFIDPEKEELGKCYSFEKYPKNYPVTVWFI